MDFVTFKNKLYKKKINLYDTEYRIAYFRYNNLNNFKQSGGSIVNNNVNLIDKFDNNVLFHLIDSLLNNNKMKTQWIIDNY